MRHANDECDCGHAPRQPVHGRWRKRHTGGTGTNRIGNGPIAKAIHATRSITARKLRAVDPDTDASRSNEPAKPITRIRPLHVASPIGSATRSASVRVRKLEPQPNQRRAVAVCRIAAAATEQSASHNQRVNAVKPPGIGVPSCARHCSPSGGLVDRPAASHRQRLVRPSLRARPRRLRNQLPRTRRGRRRRRRLGRRRPGRQPLGRLRRRRRPRPWQDDTLASIFSASKA